jgi:Ca2+-transporting ATPase
MAESASSSPPTLPFLSVVAPWTLDASDVAGRLGSDPDVGLSETEAAVRVAIEGPNSLEERGRVPAWRRVAEQFANAMILVLLAAAAVTTLIGELKDTVVILAIVLLNAVIGFVQEHRAEKAMEALRRMTSPTSVVIRDGSPAAIPAGSLVPGDVVRLEAGDVVTADLRLLEARALRINEAALTGESEPAEKISAALPDVPDAVLADQRNMAFSGTAVTYGRGRGVVVATGMATALGRVASMLQEGPAGRTPLQRRLDGLGRWLAALALGICALVFVAGVVRGEAVDVMFLTAVSLAVAAIPEGLPAVVTIALALGARRMARREALIRKLPAVETLGSVTVVCSDKTGTLTENRMLVERVWTPNAEYTVSGDGYEPAGRIEPDPGADAAFRALVQVAAACNDATLRGPSTVGGDWEVTGDPTEGALLALAAKAGVDGALHPDRPRRTEELTFDAERRRMATIHDRLGARVWVAVKGALESVGPLVDAQDASVVRAAERRARELAADGYRVLALAERELPAVPSPLESAEQDLGLLGLVAMADPPRPAAAPSIEAARKAGIRPVMITGDHPLTAAAIARRVGLLDGDARVLTGAELAELDDPAFEALVDEVVVYARTSPEQKVRIVAALQGHGEVVAMTGDGVNDAPALRLADIGVAMGIMGTEVSKEAADMVLADDDFATIVRAVQEGRRIYDNIRRVVRYLLATNTAEVAVVFAAPFVGLPLPLQPIQILWVNLVTDGPPALALGVEPVEPDAMERPPRPPREPILGRGLWQRALLTGILMALVTLGVQALAIDRDWPWQTMVFTTLAFLQLANAIAVRSERRSALSLGWRTNVPLVAAVATIAAVQLALVYVPALQPIFDTEALGPVELGVVLLASSVGFLAVEIQKWLERRLAARRSISA